jgi:hypothetical protein
MSERFIPSAKSKILWTEVDGNWEVRHGIRLISYTSTYDYPGKRVHYIEHFQISGTVGQINNTIGSHGNLYPYVGTRPTYKQVKLIFNLTDCKESVEYLEKNHSLHAPYVIDQLALKYYLKKLGRKRCLELGWNYGIIDKLHKGVKYDCLT